MQKVKERSAIEEISLDIGGDIDHHEDTESSDTDRRRSSSGVDEIVRKNDAIF